MTLQLGPVVVGMGMRAGAPGRSRVDEHADEPGRLRAAIDLAARQAIRRHVDLRLVYGMRDLPSSEPACDVIAPAADRLAAAYPHLVVTAALYPGTGIAALIEAARTASLVVVTARLDDEPAFHDLLDRLSSGPASVLLVGAARATLDATPTPTPAPTPAPPLVAPMPASPLAAPRMGDRSLVRQA